MFSTLRVGLTVGLGLWAAAGTAAAQQPCATCPPDGSAHGPRLPRPARDVHPLMQKRHDSKYCYPMVCPGSCFGYFRTNWTAWEQACPHWCAELVVIAGQVVTPPVTVAPVPAVEPVPAPKELPPAPPAKEKEPAKESSQLPPVFVPKPIPVAPVSVPTDTAYPSLPPVPDLPIGLPPTPPAAGPSKS